VPPPIISMFKYRTMLQVSYKCCKISCLLHSNCAICTIVPKCLGIVLFPNRVVWSGNI